MGHRLTAWAAAWALLAMAAGAAWAHELATSKSITVRAQAPWIQLLVTYSVGGGAGDALRELAGVDPGDGRDRPSAASRARLEALVVERATFGLRLEVDGVDAPLTHTPEATAGVRRADRQLAVALRSVAGRPVFCGWHWVTIRDRAPAGGTTWLRWPDGASEVLTGRVGEASRWLWICGKGG